MKNSKELKEMRSDIIGKLEEIIEFPEKFKLNSFYKKVFYLRHLYWVFYFFLIPHLQKKNGRGVGRCTQTDFEDSGRHGGKKGPAHSVDLSYRGPCHFIGGGPQNLE